MPFVLDASVAACWLLPDEMNTVAGKAISRLSSDTGFVPQIWWFEMHNTLLNSERSKRIDANTTNTALNKLAHLALKVDYTPDSAFLLHLARKHILTAYDAAYLELSLRESVPLATIDNRLASAARAESVNLI
jgi:predicted nucleic acid-binding protein